MKKKIVSTFMFAFLGLFGQNKQLKIDNKLPSNAMKKENTLSQPKNNAVEYFGKTVDKMITDFMSEHNVPGVSLAIVRAPYIPYVAGYGNSDIDKNLLVSSNTLFDIGQMAKTFTMIATMQLVEENKMSISDNIGKFLPNIPNAWKKVTIKQLLQNSSCIPCYTTSKKFNPFKDATPEELIDLVKDEKLACETGKEFNRSATDFLLLAMIIEKVSGMSYKNFVIKNQIERLNLKNVKFVEDLNELSEESKNVTANNRHTKFKTDYRFINPSEPATAYKEEDKTIKNSPLVSSKAFLGSGGIWATAEDISTWDMGLAGTILLAKKENRDFIFKPTVLDNGKKIPAMSGWNFTFHKGFTDIHSHLSYPGFSSYLSRFTDPSELICVTLLCNKEGVNLVELAANIAAAFDNRLGNGVNPDYVNTIQSAFSVEETANRIKSKLDYMKVPIFAYVDHSKNAKEVNQKLNPTVVITFGKPEVGTSLMEESPSISVDLPLKITIWEDKEGHVFVGYTNPDHLAKIHNINKNINTIKQMKKMLRDVVTSAIYQKL